MDLSNFEPLMIFASLNGRVAPRVRLGIVGSGSPKSSSLCGEMLSEAPDVALVPGFLSHRTL